MKTILLIHGPNLNMLGKRDPEHYGSFTLPELEDRMVEESEKRCINLIMFQSNHEGALIDFLQVEGRNADAIIINPGALTHYSYALHDAIQDAKLPALEVHLSDIKNREAWRSVSVIAPACLGQIMGKGIEGYIEALDILAR
ncbi:MAG: 3-dehydroquinate dehydratase [Candidatus Magasanikbacteria bacterium]|nr:3-dehydroquinate dehydratase [Candidatus Magasanikbacteria bacterium]